MIFKLQRKTSVHSVIPALNNNLKLLELSLKLQKEPDMVIAQIKNGII